MAIGRQDAHILEYDGCVNYMKGAIECADKVSTVSPSYAQEILDPLVQSWAGRSAASEKQYKLCGILNGIDVKSYDPSTDPNLADNYSASNFGKHKPACKKELQSLFGLNDWPVPVVAMVTRLVGHKGVDLVRHVAQDIINNGLQLVVLGSGEAEYESFFRELAARNPGAVGVKSASSRHWPARCMRVRICS